MTSPTLEGHLSIISCPLCSSPQFQVVRPSQYPANMSVEEFQDAFRASSDHTLLDQLVRCESCSLIYINPRVSEEILLKGYSSAVDPDFVAQNAERIRTSTRSLRKIMRRLNIGENSRLKILDIGCAGGAFLVAARDCGLQPVGIEPSHWLAEFGRKNYNLEVHQGILTAGKFPAESFDLASLWDVIEHVTDTNLLLANIRSILKPGGTLIVNYPDYGSWAARILGNKWPFLLSVHLLYYTRTTATEQLRRAGFEIKDVRPHFQTLPLGYVLRRATAYVGFAAYLRRFVEAVGLAQVPVSYNMGQTLVVATKI